MLAIGAIAAIGTFVVWRIGGPNWRALLSAWVGIAAGGGFIWAVRIVASRLLGREAMGFGDVTLLAMIGRRYLGLAGSTLVIFLPFAIPLHCEAGLELVGGDSNGLFSRGSQRTSATDRSCAWPLWVTILRWPDVWSSVADMFSEPWLVPAALVICLLLMVPLLWLVRFVGDRLRNHRRFYAGGMT